MEIKTKYNVGDKLWTIKDCKAYEFEVEIISVYVNSESIDVKYYQKGNILSTDSHEEKNCFSTKTELIDAL